MNIIIGHWINKLCEFPLIARVREVSARLSTSAYSIYFFK